MGYKFSIILNREITDDESVILLGGCSGTTLSTAPHPTIADVIATQMEVDNTEAPTLTEAIQSALDAVAAVPDMLPASLTVPAESDGEPESPPTDSAQTTPADDGTAIASEPEPADRENAVVVPKPRRKRPTAKAPHRST